jgi:hypothetical protein
MSTRPQGLVGPAALVVAALLAAGCGAPGGEDEGRDAGSLGDGGLLADAGVLPDAGPGGPPGYEADLRPLFDSQCGFCHGASAMGSLDLRGAPQDTLIDVPSAQVPAMSLVACGDRAESYLWHKLVNTHLAAGGSGMVMPPGQPLESSELGLVQDWIEGGCLD